nr:hypothetical protein [Tanacetum cinerariifolium]
GASQDALKDQGYLDSGCSRYMTGNISYLIDFKKHDGGYVAFGGGAKGGKITRKGTIRTDQLGKLDGKSNEGIFVGYSTTSKAFRVYNIRTRKVEENLHITFLENKPMIAGGGPEGLFDIDALSKSMNYAPVSAGTNSNDFAGNGASFDAASKSDNQKRPNAKSSTKTVNTVGLVNTATPTYADYPNDLFIPDLEDVEIFDDAYDDRDEGAEANYNNFETVMSVSSIFSTRIHKDHPKEYIIREVNYAVQTRKMAKQNEAGLISFINKQRRTNHKDFQNCLFACFLSQMEPKKVHALDDESWVEAMQEELLQFKLLNVWTLVDLPLGKRAIRTKWVYRNKREQRGIIFKNEARLVAQGHRQEEGIDYDEFFSLAARIEAISVKSASTPMETHKPLSKDAARIDVDVHLYRSMIGSLMYLTSSKTDIMFDVCACSRFQVQPKVSHMHAVKRIFKYLKGQPTLGLWYPKDPPLELIAYSDSDYAGVSLDRKSTRREYIAASNCYGQVLWLQNQLLDYGYNFMQTKIHVDNESAICVVKNLVYHSKTKRIEIRHHFIRDFYVKRLIEIVKIHTDYNVADILTKVFDVTRLELKGYLINDGYADLVQHASDYFNIFWNAANSKTINFVKQIHAIVDGKAVVISESSVRSDLLFEDEDGITCLTNDEIFENLALMGYEPLSTKLTFQKETELRKKLKKKEMIQLSLDEELAQKLYAKELAKEATRQDQERPFSEAELRKNMIMYLKNQGGYKHSHFKGIKELDLIFSKEAQRNKEEMKLYMRIIPDEDIAIDVIPLATKPSVMVEYKIVKEGKISTYLIVRADGSTKRFKNLHIFLLVEKVYPLTHATITKMLEMKLQADQWNEMCYQLLTLMMKQLRKG